MTPPPSDPAPDPKSRPRSPRWRLPELERRSLRVLVLASVAVFLVAVDSQALVLALGAIGQQFHAQLADLSELGVFIQLGAIAGLALGLLSDRLGRRRVLILSVAGFSLVDIASAAAPTLAVLTALRVVAVCLETGAGATAGALVIEELAPGARPFGVSLLAIAGGAGAGVSTVLWPLIAPHWRVLYLIGAVGLPGAGVLWLWLRESEAWVAAAADRGRPLALRLLFASPWRARTAVALLTSLLGAVLYVPANLFYAERGDQLGLGSVEVSAVIVVGAVLSIPAFAIGSWLANRYGRRRVAIGLGVITALFTVVAFLGGERTYWTGNVLWTIAASASTPVVGTWFGELFPTRGRATAGSLTGVAGAVGGVIGFGILRWVGTAHGLGAAIACTGVAAIAGTALLLLLPETEGRPLPE